MKRWAKSGKIKWHMQVPGCWEQKEHSYWSLSQCVDLWVAWGLLRDVDGGSGVTTIPDGSLVFWVPAGSPQTSSLTSRCLCFPISYLGYTLLVRQYILLVNAINVLTSNRSLGSVTSQRLLHFASYVWILCARLVPSVSVYSWSTDIWGWTHGDPERACQIGFGPL